MTALGAIALIFLLLALLSGGASVRRVRRRRLLAAGGQAGLCGCSLAVAALLGGVALNLYSYQRLTFEQPVARLQFRQLGPQHYLATLEPAGTRVAQQYELRGEQWQLDARVLKLHGWANLLGLDSHYRLERLSGRYAAAAEERSRPRTVHDLAQQRGLDLWQLARAGGAWLPGVDAQYGSAAYLPMRDRAEYLVSMSQSGLVARPANEPARQGGWN